ncbi:helix-turn-helix transcriptional regulator [Enterococcus casseliflavus]|uniref:helix-turn-helix transcriptional regulator n=1 Tax=Enterococcus casseliflavus TaxID=37734 RepID=UPI0022E566FE|nr:helix-turn-helix transcriptional regulator [Enterococcus casseliflavus]
MNLSKQIKKHRERLSLSQEGLAEKLYVSRQTISNWENEKSYPDVHNLLLLSVLFDVSLDELVKGDVEQMKVTIEKTAMDHYTKIMLVFTLLAALSVGPALFLPGNWWIAPPLCFWLVSMYAALKIEKIKKTQNIKTYKEIVAFMENQDLDAIRKKRDIKKDFLSKTVIVVVFALIVGIIAWLSTLPHLLMR